VSIVRVGLAETKHFSEGYEAIFGKKNAERVKPAYTEASAPPRRKKSRAAGKHSVRTKAKSRNKRPAKKGRK
jgi:hypothetical protein